MGFHGAYGTPRAVRIAHRRILKHCQDIIIRYVAEGVMICGSNTVISNAEVHVASPTHHRIHEIW